MLDQDVKHNIVTEPGSHSRNLLRVKRGLDMVRILFGQILVTEYVSLPPYYVSIFPSFSFKEMNHFDDCVLTMSHSFILSCQGG